MKTQHSGNQRSRYSAFQLFSKGLTQEGWPEVWSQREMKSSYDVVIIGGGLHGLATAYYLAKNHGITNIAVLAQGYIGGGGSGRNPSILRSHYLHPDGVRFYDRSLNLYEELSGDLNFNLMFAQVVHMSLAHDDGGMRTMRWRAEVNKAQGVNSEVIGPEEVEELVPYIDVSKNTRYPVLGALYHPPGGTIRHDAEIGRASRRE